MYCAMCIDVRDRKRIVQMLGNFMDIWYIEKRCFSHVQAMQPDSWYIGSHLSLLLHLAEIISHLELGSSLFLHLLDGHARCDFSKSETTVLAVDLEDTLFTLVSKSSQKQREKRRKEKNSPNR